MVAEGSLPDRREYAIHFGRFQYDIRFNFDPRR